MSDITEGLDLLGDWLDAKGYAEEAGLCTRAMDEINRLKEELEKLRSFHTDTAFEFRRSRAENARLEEINEIHQRAVADLNGIILHMQTTNARLRELLKECADDIEAECKAKHGFTGNNPIHPVSCRLYERDMVLVRAARAAMGDE